MAGQDDDYYTREEAERQLGALTDAQWARLERLASWRALESAEYSWRDLLQDALLKIIEGHRRWPRKMGVAAFISEVMRSLVSAHAKSTERKRGHADVRSAVELASPEPDREHDVVQEHRDDSSSPEDIARAEQVLGQVREFFANDEEAWDVLEWMSEGFARAEVQQEFELTDTAYDTITKRIRRKLASIKSALESGV